MTGRVRARTDTVIAAVLLAVACAYAWMAYNLPVRNIPGSVGLSFVPLLLAGLLAFLTLLLLLQGLLRGSGSPPDAGMPGWARAGAVVGLMLLYICILALTRIGFLMATPPYLALTMWQCGDRRPGFIVSTAVGVTFAIWVTFATLFAVPLPRGPLF